MTRLGADMANDWRCWAKFMARPATDVLLEGYVSSDGRHWVCKTCFGDFMEMFAWKTT